MKKILPLILILTLIFTMTSYASPQINDTHSFDLLLSYDLSNGSNVKLVKSLSQYDAKMYLQNKEIFIEKNMPTLEVLLNKNTTNLKEISINEKSSTLNTLQSVASTLETNNMDFGLIETWMSESDASTSTTCYKNIRLNFQWHDDPQWFWKDGLGVQHTGASLGMTNYKNLQCVYYDTYGRRYDNSSSVEYVAGGVKGDILLRNGCYGYLSFDVGNNKSAVTKNANFVAYGKYGHTYVGLGGLNITFNLSGVSIGGTAGSFVAETTQVSKNYIFTY